MMKLSARRARAEESAREANRRNLAAVAEGVAGAVLDVLHLYDAGRVTPEQNAEFGVLAERMRAELAPIINPLDKARAALDALDAERATYAP